MRAAVATLLMLALTACGTTKILTRLVAAKCPVQQPAEKPDPKMFEHVAEHAPKELSCEEAKRVAVARLDSIQQCNIKLDKLKEAKP